MSETDTKPWWLSQTIISALALFVFSVVREHVPGLTENEVLDILTQLGQFITLLYAVRGRFKATKRVTLLRADKP